MSHFSVAVLSRDNDELETLLAPYDEDIPVSLEREADGSIYTCNPDAKWDWWVEGGRWHDWAVETLGFVSGMVGDLKTREFTTHAVVTPDGEWHEVGSMWWFGISSETEDDVDRWESEYADRFLSDGSLRITIVDCHI